MNIKPMYQFSTLMLSALPILGSAGDIFTNQVEIIAQGGLLHKNENDLVTSFDHGLGESLALRLISDASFGDWKIFEGLEGQLHFQVQQNYNDPSILLPVFSQSDFRMTQINNTQENVFAQIDRANISFTTGELEWIVGRQPMSVGVTRMASISQIYNSNFPWNSSGYGYGVDAINLNYYLGTNDNVNAVVFLNQLDNKNSMALIRYQSTLYDQDVSITLQKTKELYSVNATIDAYLGNYALWSEASVFFSSNDQILAEEQFKITIGGDYYLQDLYGQIEYHYNSFGCQTINNCNKPLIFSEYIYTGQPLFNQQYAYINNSYPLTDLSNLAVVNIINLNELAIMNQFIWTNSVNDNFEWNFMLSNSIVFSDEANIKASHEFSQVPLQGTLTAQFYF